MVHSNVVYLFSNKADRRHGDAKRSSKAARDAFVSKWMTLEIRSQATGRLRYECRAISSTVSKKQISDLMDSYKAAGDDVLHAFIGAECQIMRFFIELEGEEVEYE